MNDPKLMRQFGIANRAVAKPHSQESIKLIDEVARQYTEQLDASRAKTRSLGKQLGRAGDTIHRLRADIALMRYKGGDKPAVTVDLYLAQRRENDELRKENLRLRENLTMAYRERRADEQFRLPNA